MKSLKLIVFGMALFLASAMQAQVAVSVNIGTPPPWGPSGYTEVRYYYIPDVEAYYDVQASMFIYEERGRWVHRAYLPSRYRSYDLYGGYKVVMKDYRGEAPYNNYAEYRTKYPRGHRGEFQKTIGERPGRGQPRENMHSKEQPKNRENHGNVKSSEHNFKANQRGNDKHMKEEKGHDNGKDKGKKEK